MGWIGWTLTILFVLWVIGIFASASKKTTTSTKGPRSRSGQPRDIETQAQEIAGKIRNLKQLRSLRKRIEAHQDRMSALGTHSDGAYNKDLMLNRAMEIAKQNVPREGQVIPSVALTTPSSALNIAYKCVTEEEWQKISEAIPEDAGFWYRQDEWNEPEEPDENIPVLKEFRKIVESDLPRQEQIKRINKFVEEQDGEFQNTFFRYDDKLTPGDEWFAMQLEMDGLPMAYELYSEGYTTPEECLRVDPVEFRKKRGVGPKKVEQLIQYQKNVEYRTQHEDIMKKPMSNPPNQTQSDE